MLYTFERTEKKYIVNTQQYEYLLKIMSDYMTPDEYGKYTICNIYFDTDDYYLIRSSLEKPLFKEKLRLRTYGVPGEDSNAFLEIKRKYDGVVYKRRVILPYRKAMDYLTYEVIPENAGQVFREIDYFFSFYKPEPKVFLAYDRVAYKGMDDENFRITFDSKIRYRENDLELAKGDYGKLLLSEDKRIMEIKSTGAMPFWLSTALNDLSVFPTSFSKYGNVYSNEILSTKESSLCLQV